MDAVHYSSVHDGWGTPPDFFAALDQEFHFTLDPCCTIATAKCKKFYTPADDGLSKSWAGEIVFMNPPYGRPIKDWVRKAYRESLRGATVVCLVPARTDTVWWHTYCMKGEVRFIKGRLKFVNGACNNPAPFPSAVVIFRPGSGLV